MIYLLVLLFPKDFEACTQALHRRGYSTPELTAASGTSAGGLIVGAVCNRSPELFKAVILKVGYSIGAGLWDKAPPPPPPDQLAVV